MSGRGGIYEGPGGQKLYGDGREVSPVRSLDSLEKDRRQMTAPTKGPYVVGKPFRLTRIPHVWKVAVLAASKTVGYGHGETREEAQANAQLFAAAWERDQLIQELREALRNTLKFCGRTIFGEHYQESCDQISAAHAALAKADGK